VAHPAVFRENRYIKRGDGRPVPLPSPDRSRIAARGVRVAAGRDPRPLLGGELLYLGEIPRRTAFEKGIAGARYREQDAERFDAIEDDSAVVANLAGRGLVVLSGCAHSGIVNTLVRAREVTGVDRIFAVMGGFHLTGKEFEPAVAPTAAALKEIDPRYIVPTHCTGRRAVIALENEMPDKFLLNMSGTRMVFSS
jgi:7,8-dihydropterin-6-yl-methyl-4-(beta-D-ribofuranosyl)aminobenzene 5'-phosphate synthase